MKKYIIILCTLMILTGCVVTNTTTLREQGFKTQLQAFDSIPSSPGLFKSVEIQVRIIVVEDVGYVHDIQPGSDAIYMHPHRIIVIPGKRGRNGEIILSEALIGHEILHALQLQVGGFMNPDEFGYWGY